MFFGEFCLTSRIFFWYRCYYPHRSRDALSPVCMIFLIYSINCMGLLLVLSFHLAWKDLLLLIKRHGFLCDFLDTNTFLLSVFRATKKTDALRSPAIKIWFLWIVKISQTKILKPHILHENTHLRKIMHVMIHFLSWVRIFYQK